MIGSDEYFIPYNDSIDMAEEAKKIEKEIEYIKEDLLKLLIINYQIKTLLKKLKNLLIQKKK